MAQCAYCGSTILFGGHRIGEYRFCGPRCVIGARASGAVEPIGGATAQDLAQMRDDILIIADELQQQRTQQNELLERLDFLERTLTQMRHGLDQARRSEPPGR